MEQQQQQQRNLLSFASARSAACGVGVSTAQSTMSLSITSTTGSPVELTVPRGETVEGLRTRISQRLRLQTDRILLLHRDKQLTAGRLLDLGVADGSKLTLVPVIEAGLICSSTKAERTVMDVLESLTEVEISDFLSGRSPLTINLGVGAHTMYVQLQLSAQDVKELRQDEDVRVPSSSSELEPGLQTSSSVTNPGFASAWSSTNNSSGSATSLPASQTSIPAPDTTDSTFPIQLTLEHLDHLLTQQFQATNYPPLPPLETAITTHLYLKAVTVYTPLPGSFNPFYAPQLPTSQLSLTSCHTRLFSHSLLLQSWTLEPSTSLNLQKGTLAPHSQTSVCHPRRGIAIILQILNDLLRAACNHQGAPPSLPQHCPSFDPPVNPALATEEPSKERNKPPVSQRVEHVSKASGEESPPLRSSTEEDQTLQCKLERLQFLMHQRRLRRRARRSSHLSQTPHPYHRRHHRP
ncbi:hypothetical protein INR49_010565 [Caranx melampygus]|nr:hypothetical protein INR49_010565 [Caranx melampygus]